MKRDLKIRIWKWIAFVGFSLSLLLGVGVNAQTASELMNRMAEVYKSSGCIDISASVTVKSVVPENNGKSEFTMLLKGKKFKMDTPEMTLIFDLRAYLIPLLFLLFVLSMLLVMLKRFLARVNVLDIILLF